MTQTIRTRGATGRPGASAWIGGMLGRLGVLAAVLALALVGGAVGRDAAPAAAATTARLCDSSSWIPTTSSACVDLTQDTPDLRAHSNRANWVGNNNGPIALYTDTNYRGRCQTFHAGPAVWLADTWVGENSVSSVRMSPCLASDNNGVKIWSGNPSASGPGFSVADVKVITGDSSSIGCGSGWTKDNVDLNRGAGGDFVYLCYRMAAGGPIRDMYAVAGNTANAPCSDPSHYKVPGDLNKGAGGQFIYFCVITDEQYDPYDRFLAGVRIVRVGSSGITASQAHAIAEEESCGGDFLNLDWMDLNRGAGGDYIFTCRQILPNR